MTTISLRLDDDVKRGLDQMCSEMGMSLTTFFTIYAKRALRDRKIPFEITAPEPDIDEDKLDWDKIAKLLEEGRQLDGDSAPRPWDEVCGEMRKRIHGRDKAV